MNPVSRVINAFAAPQATFQAEQEKSLWYVPFVLFLVLTIVGTVIMRPLTQKIQEEKIVETMEKQGLPQEQIDEALERTKNMGAVMTIVPAVLIQTATFFVTAAIWLFVANVILAGNARYVQMLSVTAYSWLVVAVGMLIKAPIMTAKESINVHFSPAVILSNENSFIYKLLAQFDLFNIWCFFLVTIGIAVMTGKKAQQVWPWTALFFLIYFLGAAAMQSAFGF